MSKGAAKASVRHMRQLGDRPLLNTALAAGDITDSLAFTIADWTRKLPAEMRTETDRILLDAACQFHHDVCIHRWGWQLILHPETTEARSPDGKQILHSHAPPAQNAA